VFSLAQLYLKTTFCVRAAGLLLAIVPKVTKKTFRFIRRKRNVKIFFCGGKRKFNAIHCAYQKADIKAISLWTLLGYKKEM